MSPLPFLMLLTAALLTVATAGDAAAAACGRSAGDIKVQARRTFTVTYDEGGKCTVAKGKYVRANVECGCRDGAGKCTLDTQKGGLASFPETVTVGGRRKCAIRRLDNGKECESRPGHC